MKYMIEFFSFLGLVRQIYRSIFLVEFAVVSLHNITKNRFTTDSSCAAHTVKMPSSQSDECNITWYAYNAMHAMKYSNISLYPCNVENNVDCLIMCVPQTNFVNRMIYFHMDFATFNCFFPCRNSVKENLI